MRTKSAGADKCWRSRACSRRRATATVRRRCWARPDPTNTRPPRRSHHRACACPLSYARAAHTTAAAARHSRLPHVPTASPVSGDAEGRAVAHARGGGDPAGIHVDQRDPAGELRAAAAAAAAAARGSFLRGAPAGQQRALLSPHSSFRLLSPHLLTSSSHLLLSPPPPLSARRPACSRGRTAPTASTRGGLSTSLPCRCKLSPPLILHSSSTHPPLILHSCASASLLPRRLSCTLAVAFFIVSHRRIRPKRGQPYAVYTARVLSAPLERARISERRIRSEQHRSEQHRQ